ncbi:MAG: K(+)-transporting ATPase subunit F [Brachymonas sp.]|nr:K(+)-transporting ATPase subunit F [Brachymonas sp.]
MSLLYGLALLVVIALFIYLVVVLFYPEYFS